MVDRKSDHLDNIFFSYCNNFFDLRLVVSNFFKDISKEFSGKFYTVLGKK